MPGPPPTRHVSNIFCEGLLQRRFGVLDIRLRRQSVFTEDFRNLRRTSKTLKRLYRKKLLRHAGLRVDPACLNISRRSPILTLLFLFFVVLALVFVVLVLLLLLLVQDTYVFMLL